MNGRIVIALAFGLGTTVLCASPSSAAAPQAAQLQLPVYVGASPAASAVIRIERLRQDYQRKAFFRIGVLPAALAEGVVIELRDPAQATEVFASAATSLRSLSRNQAVDIHRVSVCLPGRAAPVLQAEALSLGSNGEWRFSRDVLLSTPTNSLRTSQVLLTTQGPRAGHFQWGRNASLPLLECLQPKDSSP